MAAQNPIPTPLPADLPENWSIGQTVSPTGTDAGLTQQHGYNYLMEQVNSAQEAVNTIGEAFTGLASTSDLQGAQTDISGLQSAVSALQTGKASRIFYTASVLASGWSSTAPYTQTVTVNGILATDTPHLQVQYTGDSDNQIAQLISGGFISQITTAANAVTLTCFLARPTVDFAIQLEVVR